MEYRLPEGPVGTVTVANAVGISRRGLNSLIHSNKVPADALPLRDLRSHSYYWPPERFHAFIEWYGTYRRREVYRSNRPPQGIIGSVAVANAVGISRKTLLSLIRRRRVPADALPLREPRHRYYHWTPERFDTFVKWYNARRLTEPGYSKLPAT